LQDGRVGPEMIVDIDDRRATEAALATSEERQAFQLKLNDTMRPLADPLDVQRQVARIRLKATLCTTPT
jgi:hypothetical protein